MNQELIVVIFPKGTDPDKKAEFLLRFVKIFFDTREVISAPEPTVLNPLPIPDDLKDLGKLPKTQRNYADKPPKHLPTSHRNNSFRQKARGQRKGGSRR